MYKNLIKRRGTTMGVKTGTHAKKVISRAAAEGAGGDGWRVEGVV